MGFFLEFIFEILCSSRISVESRDGIRVTISVLATYLSVWRKCLPMNELQLFSGVVETEVHVADSIDGDDDDGVATAVHDVTNADGSDAPQARKALPQLFALENVQCSSHAPDDELHFAVIIYVSQADGAFQYLAK
ncbi:unnamed protein product [Nesidiocoris tenuis]|uniref:Uncharacterized protein n=1 Tax=Nesidiocoris tenuis TaxID=355587 RepID=A0A6H5HFP8_9HEMI|nr:unnamed protein product [Nesidiocoris tenuis]